MKDMENEYDFAQELPLENKIIVDLLNTVPKTN